jgi:hypothetical protein
MVVKGGLQQNFLECFMHGFDLVLWLPKKNKNLCMSSAYQEFWHELVEDNRAVCTYLDFVLTSCASCMSPNMCIESCHSDWTHCENIPTKSLSSCGTFGFVMIWDEFQSFLCQQRLFNCG